MLAGWIRGPSQDLGQETPIVASATVAILRPTQLCLVAYAECRRAGSSDFESAFKICIWRNYSLKYISLSRPANGPAPAKRSPNNQQHRRGGLTCWLSDF